MDNQTMNITRWWLALVLLMLLMLPAWLPASAQNEITLNQLEVDIWPEYDRQDVLVIYRLTLDENTTLPASLTFRIPVIAGDPYNVAVRDTDGLLYNVSFTRTVQDNWSLVRFITPSNEVQFEYYDPGLRKNETQRSYTYQWPGDYPVNSLSIQVQQPVGAHDMTITPALGSGQPGAGGLVYYTAVIGAVPAGNPFSVTVDYLKESQGLSVETLRVEPPGPIDEQTTGRLTVNEVLPWVLGGTGMVLIGGGVWWYWQSGRGDRPGRGDKADDRKRHGRAVREMEMKPETAEESGVYCSQCGRRASPGDHYCRACGTRLRVS
jgi:hypothetical protein